MEAGENLGLSLVADGLPLLCLGWRCCYGCSAVCCGCCILKGESSLCKTQPISLRLWSKRRAGL